MLSQQDMEDFMEIDTALVERDEDAAKPEKPSGTVQGGTNAGDEVPPCPTRGACTTTTSRRMCGACCQPAIKSPNCWHGSPSGREPEPFPGREAVRRLHSA